MRIVIEVGNSTMSCAGLRHSDGGAAAPLSNAWRVECPISQLAGLRTMVAMTALLVEELAVAVSPPT
jgi:hypothetical protein